MSQGEYFDADMGALWVQPEGPNRPVYPIFCFDTDGFDESAGDVAYRLCRNSLGQWEAVHRSQGVPDVATASLETYLPKTMTWLDEMWRLRWSFGLYIHNTGCDGDTFLDFDHTQVGVGATITSRSAATSVRGKAEAGDGAPDMKMRTYEVTTAPLPPDIWKLNGSSLVNTEPEPYRDVAFLGSARERGVCGPGYTECADGMVVADSAPAAALSTPQNITLDVVADATADPFAAAEDISSVVIFRMDRDTTRKLVACGTAAAAGLRVAYTDDNGANWTVVALNLVATDYCVHGGALFALDSRHIWLGSFEAGIWFSDDGGVTWTAQTVPTLLAAEGIYAIHFVDALNGWAVGGDPVAPTGAYLTTTDGGTIWNLLATEPVADVGTGVHVLDTQNVWVTVDDGTVHFTEDWGATYTARTARLIRTPTNLGDITALNHYLLAMCGHWIDGSGDEFGIVYRSINGGFDWEEYVYPTTYDGVIEYYGFNSVWFCNPNLIYAAGELVDSLATLWKLENTQPAT